MTARPLRIADDAILDARGITGIMRITVPSALVTTDPPIRLPEDRAASASPGAPTTRSRTLALATGTFIASRAEVTDTAAARSTPTLPVAWHPTALPAAVRAELARVERRLRPAGVECRRLTSADLHAMDPALLHLIAASTVHGSNGDGSNAGGAHVDGGSARGGYADMQIGHDRDGCAMTLRVPPWRTKPVAVAVVASDTEVARHLSAQIPYDVRRGVLVRLQVLDPHSARDAAGLRTADVVVCARLPAESATALAPAIGLSASAVGALTGIGDGMVAVVADGMVRWSRLW